MLNPLVGPRIGAAGRADRPAGRARGVGRRSLRRSNSGPPRGIMLSQQSVRPGGGRAPAIPVPAACATRRTPRGPCRRDRGRSRRAAVSVSSESSISRARSEPSSCSIVRGPMIGAVTTGLVQQPGQRHVGRLLAQLAAQTLVRLQLRPILLDLAAGRPRWRAGPPRPSRSAPPSSPPASGLQGITPKP